MFLAAKSLIQEERQGFLAKLALGTGLTGGGVAVYEFFEFIKANPNLAVGLVKSFGADFVLAITLIALLNRIISFMEKGVAATQQLADAVRQIAEKDDRQIQELQTLASFSAQESERTSSRMSEFMAILEKVVNEAKSGREMFSSIDQKLDKVLKSKETTL